MDGSDILLPWRKRLQNAKSKEDQFTLTMQFAEIFKARYESLAQLAAKGNTDVIERLEFLVGCCKGDVLDIGSFDGFYSIELARRGHKVIGLDMLPLCVEYARGQIREEDIDLSFVQGFAEELPFDSYSFDTTIISHTLEHVHNTDLSLSEAARVTKGSLIAIVPTSLGNDPMHVRYIPSLKLREMLEFYGRVSQEFKIGKGIGYICEVR